MRHLLLWTSSVLLGVGLLAGTSEGAGSQPAEHPPTNHRHPEAQKLKNPIPGTPSSVARGKQIFLRHCEQCHGKGDGKGDMGDFLDTPPANLTDAEWRHGSSPGEIFTVIRDGTDRDMETFKERLSEEEIWHVVNYVLTLSEPEEG